MFILCIIHYVLLSLALSYLPKMFKFTVREFVINKLQKLRKKPEFSGLADGHIIV